MAQADWLGECAQAYPHRIAVVDAASGRRHTFQSFDTRANQIAHFCEQWVGLLPGDRVGLLSTPSDDVLQIVVAAGKLGLTALLFDPGASPESLIAAMNEHGPRTVFHGLAQAGLVREIWFEVNSVEHLIPLRGFVDTANFEDIVAHYPPLPGSWAQHEDVPWIHFVAEEMAWANPEAAESEDALASGQDVIAAPLHRPASLAAALRALRVGQCVIVESDGVRIIESPGEMASPGEGEDRSTRNMSTGPSWLPHEFV